MPISIQIDKREPLNEIRPMMTKILTAKKSNIVVKYESLIYNPTKKETDGGDYYIKNGRLDMRIERKEIHDFVGSYGPGDLKEKLWYMRQKADRTALIIEGHYVTKTGNGQMFLDRGNGLEPVMPLQTYVRYLTSQQEKQTWIYYTNNLFETLLSIVYLAEYLPILHTPNPSVKCGNVEELLVQLPGLGPKTLRELQEKYTSPLEALKDAGNWMDKKQKRVLENW